jgi:hypothetical protein
VQRVDEIGDVVTQPVQHLSLQLERAPEAASP